MPNLETAVQAMYWAADSNQVGYSQSDRTNIVIRGKGLYNSDCSWLTIMCLRYGGFDTGGASYSGDIVPELVKKGWKKLPNNGNPKPGDVLVAEGQHVALMLHDGNLGQASIDENGRISGGRPGDQTGSEVNTRPYYNYPWTCYLRWEGEEDKSRIVQLYGINGTAAQDWHLLKNADGTYTLINRACGLALDVRGAGKTKGTIVQLYPKNNTAAQNFLLKQLPKEIVPNGKKDKIVFDPPAARPWVLIPKIATDMRVDCINGGTKADTRLQLWPRNYSLAQAWAVVDHFNGYVTLINCGIPSLALDAMGGGK